MVRGLFTRREVGRSAEGRVVRSKAATDVGTLIIILREKERERERTGSMFQLTLFDLPPPTSARLVAVIRKDVRHPNIGYIYTHANTDTLMTKNFSCNR